MDEHRYIDRRDARVRLALLLGSLHRPRVSSAAALVMVGGAAALTYLSWPVGYLVNRLVVAGGLASDLEVPGQPFFWLFILLDIVSGFLMVVLAAAGWRRLGDPGVPRARTALVAYGIFGLSSIVSAGVPLSCGSGRAELLACGTTANSYGLHDAISVLGYLALFGALMVAMRHAWRDRLVRPLAGATVAVGALWCVSGITFLVVTLARLPEVEAQHALLLLTSLAIFLVPAMLFRRQRDATPLSDDG